MSENYAQIAELMLNELVEPLADKGIKLEWTGDVPNALASKRASGVRGARDLRNVIRREVEDKIAAAIIDRIDVVPINAESMKLEVKLKTDLSTEIAYIRDDERFVRRSGHICKKMIDSYKMQ